MKIDPDGYKFVALFAILSAASFTGFYMAKRPVTMVAACIFAVLALYTMYFFRDPERHSPESGDAVISAADGVVVDVSKVKTEGLDEGETLRIAVFMNVFNVHVNRSPLPGTVVRTAHYPGKKLSAYNRRAEYENEHGDTDIATQYGTIRVRQIAGLIARRVVTRVKPDDILKRGDKIGLIRFGSRVDIFLPVSFESTVEVGQHVKAGVTVMARPKTAQK